MQNRGEVPIELDPTLFHGNWRHIIFKFQAERYLLGSYSSDHNATYVILISDHSFRDALEEEAAPHA
jgi:hypothetical protein